MYQKVSPFTPVLLIASEHPAEAPGSGVFRGFREKHLNAYLNEYAIHWNRRHSYRSAFEQLVGIVNALTPAICADIVPRRPDRGTLMLYTATRILGDVDGLPHVTCVGFLERSLSDSWTAD